MEIYFALKTKAMITCQINKVVSSKMKKIITLIEFVFHP